MSAEETGREQMTQTVTVVAVVIEGGPGTVQKVFETVMGGTAVRLMQILEANANFCLHLIIFP